MGVAVGSWTGVLVGALVGVTVGTSSRVGSAAGGPLQADPSTAPTLDIEAIRTKALLVSWLIVDFMIDSFSGKMDDSFLAHSGQVEHHFSSL
jgi:hypothetical protein